MADDTNNQQGDQTLKALVTLTQILTAANVAVPVVFGLISGLATTFRGITGAGPSPTEIADMIEQQLAANDAFGQAEVARLKALLGQQ